MAAIAAARMPYAVVGLDGGGGGGYIPQGFFGSACPSRESACAYDMKQS